MASQRPTPLDLGHTSAQSSLESATAVAEGSGKSSQTRHAGPKGALRDTTSSAMDGESSAAYRGLVDAVQSEPSGGKKKKKGKRKRGKGGGNRRQSFAVTGEEDTVPTPNINRQEETSGTTPRDRPFYKLGHVVGGNLSDTSLDSEVLLDHRDHPPMRTRRDSKVAFPGPDLAQSYRQGGSPGTAATHGSSMLGRRTKTRPFGKDADDERPTDRTPLLGPGYTQHSPIFSHGSSRSPDDVRESRMLHSRGSSRSGNKWGDLKRVDSNYDVNNPPSVPGTPKIGSDAGYDDVMLADPHPPSGVPDRRRSLATPGESLIDIDGDIVESPFHGSTPSTPKNENGLFRRHTITNPAVGDVCFPVEGLSEIAEEEYVGDRPLPYRQRRRRVRDWPDISVLESWSREEKEGRTDGVRAKKISEPVLVDGRLRPAKQRWHRAEEDLPFRFTYFNEEFPSTIHSQTFVELVQPGQTFRDLFIPDPPELSDSSSDEEDESSQLHPEPRNVLSPHGGSVAGTRHSSVAGDRSTIGEYSNTTPMNGPSGANGLDDTGTKPPKPKRFGNRPTFWLDVLSPTEEEMRMISKAFGIHPLTAEDILMQEAREKVELFRSYYFVSYKSFELDTHSEDYLEPVTLYFVVFRDGVLSFHFSQSPHPANVRRRIRQLKDYLILSADWIAYALLDDVTDVFAPLIQSIEDEVDEIDNSILQLQSDAEESQNSSKSKTALPFSSEKDDEKRSDSGETGIDAQGYLLRRIGQARRRVTLATRLLGNKADVIKAFAKRCNEQWDVAPRSEIGLYLGDIQDHIVTMNSNLAHYESLLGRAHSNYLAQLNFMTAARQEETNAVLGKLSVLGTIFLPLNVVTGMFGANFKVPGQEIDNLNWFLCTTLALLMFSAICYTVARRVYQIL